MTQTSVRRSRGRPSSRTSNWLSCSLTAFSLLVRHVGCSLWSARFDWRCSDRGAAGGERCRRRQQRLKPIRRNHCVITAVRPSPPRSAQAEVRTDELTTRGELFLDSTQHRNFTSTLTRDARFSRFFFTRLRRTTPEEAAQAPSPRYSRLLSPCAGERNWVALEHGATPVVFISLSDDRTKLRWAGGAKEWPFDPKALRVDGTRLFHPSPYVKEAEREQYGRYSLLRSTLVIDAFSDGLELDDEGGGRYRWRGEGCDIEPLREGDAIVGA